MEIFYRTKVFKAESDEPKVCIEASQLSHGEVIEAGRSRLIFLETDSLRNLKKAERKVNELKTASLLPTETRSSDLCLVNEKDSGRFINIKLPNRSDFFVKFRSFRVGEKMDASDQFETIVSGQCILGFASLKAKLEDGSSLIFRSGKFEDKLGATDIDPRRIVDWDIDNRISLYELEALCREVSFINGLQSEGTRFKRVVLNNPRVEYYLSGLEFYKNGFISSQLLTKWFDIVDKRTDRINNLTIARLDKRLSVVLKSPLDELREYIRGNVDTNSEPTLNEAFNILSKDKLWRTALSQGYPDSWIKLVKISEALEELRNSYETGKGTLIVESPKHEVTFGTATDIAESMFLRHGTSFNLMAMYPHERIIVSHPAKKTLLAHVAEPMSISTAKKVVGLYRKIPKCLLDNATE